MIYEPQNLPEMAAKKRREMEVIAEKMVKSRAVLDFFMKLEASGLGTAELEEFILGMEQTRRGTRRQ